MCACVCICMCVNASVCKCVRVHVLCIFDYKCVYLCGVSMGLCKCEHVSVCV